MGGRTTLPRFRVIHRISGETWDVEAACEDDARIAVGWNPDICKILTIQRGPLVEFKPPKVAVQIIPPQPGSTHICPTCIVTMQEINDQDFWWQCPSCDCLYHELDNKFYEAGEL